MSEGGLSWNQQAILLRICIRGMPNRQMPQLSAALYAPVKRRLSGHAAHA